MRTRACEKRESGKQPLVPLCKYLEFTESIYKGINNDDNLKFGWLPTGYNLDVIVWKLYRILSEAVCILIFSVYFE